MTRIVPALLAGSCSAILLLWATPAWSCSLIGLPQSFQFDGETVPSNVSGALYRYCEETFPAEDPELSLVDADGEPVDFSFERHRHGLYEVIFEEELVADTSYTFSAQTDCPGDFEDQWTFETTTAASEPVHLGLWRPTDPMQGTVQYPEGGACTMEAEAAYVELEFEPAPDGEAWGKAIAFETFVNGQIWEPKLTLGEPAPAGTSRLGWGEERVYALCDGILPSSTENAPNLDEGINRVEIRTWLPGTDLFWTSESHSFVIRCEEPEDEEPQDPDGDEELDADPDSDDSELDGDESGWCSQTGGSPGDLVWMVLVGLFVWRRRA